MKFDQRILDAALRTDLASFIGKSQRVLQPAKLYLHGPHIDAIAWHLHLCMTGKIKRLIINMPPRYLKSVCTSVAFPAFLLGHDPTLRLLCLSYGDGLAGDLSRNCREIMQSTFYRDLFSGTRISASKNTEFLFTMTAGGFRRAASFGGPLTGLGGDMIIIDDPLKADDALSPSKRQEVIDRFENTVSSRLDNKNDGCIILVMQRLHLDDLTGHLLEKGGWTVLSLPAIAEVEQEIPIGSKILWRRSPGDVLHPAYESLESLRKTQASMGSFLFSAQYLQRPVPEQGEIFKWEWFKIYDALPVFRNGESYVMSIDTAKKDGERNDYNVFTIWQIKHGNYFLVDVFRQKMIYPELKKAVYEVAAKYPSIDLLFEDSASGTSLYQEVYRLRGPTMNRVTAIRPEGDKGTRASTVSAIVESGQVFLPRQAPWLEAFRNEFLQFPNARHDDIVDSLVQFLKEEKRIKGTVTAMKLGGL